MKKILVQTMLDAGGMAIIRLQKTDKVYQLVAALLKGGVNLIEVSLNTPDACNIIRRITVEFRGDVLIGAGTVTDREEALDVLEAGAQYIVSPVTDGEIVRIAHEAGAPVCMGALTPTEILLAHRHGADIIKLFPADTLGPKYIKAMKDPFPNIKLMPAGGVTPENAKEWIRAGADLLGIGNALCDTTAIEAKCFATITERARLLKHNIALVRSSGAAMLV